MNAQPIRSAVLAIVLLTMAVTALAADNWPQWRGPSGTSVAAEGEYPVEFAADEGHAWKIELPGPGSSTPAVWGDAIFVTCGIEGQDGVVCYGLDGQERWRKTLGAGVGGEHRNGSGSNPSPATDGEHVVVYYKSGRVACFTPAGKELWQTNLQEKYGKDTLWWDLGTSPVIAGKNVVIAVMHAGESYLVALDLATGEEAWKQDRTYERPEESDQSYTTPQLAKIDGREVLVVWGADHLTMHDAATGERLLDDGSFNPNDDAMWRVIASPVVYDGVAVVPWGRGKFLTGVDLGESPEQSHLWQKEGFGADVPTPAARDGKAYVLADDGRIACLDVRTGEPVFDAKLPRRGDNKFYASPVLAGDKLYCVREDGTAFVGRVGEEFELLAENNMGERIIATPVPVRGNLLLRGEEHLFLITGAGAKTAAAGE